MATPRGVLWEYRRHTAAKHQILTKYLDAWIPVLAHGGHRRLIVIDGFAGPGRYAAGERGSPLLMLDAFLDRHDRDRLATHVSFFFIEENTQRAQHLQDEVDRRILPERCVKVSVINGSFEAEFPQVLGAASNSQGRLPPTFAFIDPFGADQNRPELHAQLLQLPRCEALIYLPVNHLARFVEQQDLASTLDNLYRGDRWKAALRFSDLPSRRRVLHDLFRDQMLESSRWVRSFEIVPEVGKNSYFLFFGTSSEQGLRKMKAAMWSTDPVHGQSFRDSTTVDHPVLFEAKPEVSRLLTMLETHFAARSFSFKEAADFTLTQTPFRDDAHLRSAALASAERDGRISVARKGNQRGFGDDTMMQFAAQVLL